MDVFQAFPKAIVAWYIGEMKHSSVRGNVGVMGTGQELDVIEDIGGNTEPNQSPNSQGIYSDRLLYVRPEQLPTLDPAALMEKYAMEDNNNHLYTIVDVGIGKNQETGIIEHVELKVKPISYGYWKETS